MILFTCLSVQIGGSDQWGNIKAGTDLIWRTAQAEGGVWFDISAIVEV